MAIKGVDPKCYILALFVREDGERFLLGSGRYVFKEKQQHFQANKMANDVIEVQGNDGYLLAGQVRRPGTQDFDGYVGDGTSSKEQVEQWRRDFFKFFRKNYLYKVIYVFSDGSAIQRKRGFLVDAPTVEELYQIYPEYHVALNFEDINYYFYNEDSDGNEIYGKSAIIGLTVGATGGLMWDNLGAISLPYSWLNPVSVSGTDIQINNQLSDEVPITDLQLDGDTFQQTYSGKNLVTLADKIFDGSPLLTITSVDSNEISLKANSGATSYVNKNISYDLSELGLSEGDTFTISTNMTGTYSGDTGPCLRVFYDSTSGASVTMLKTNKLTDTLTIPSGSTKLRLYFYVAIGAVPEENSTATFTNVQIEKSNQFTGFEPYVGGTASPNPDYPQDIQVVTGEQTVEVTGKNLFDKSTVAGVSSGANWDGNILTSSTFSTSSPVNTTVYISPFIPIDQEYTISVDLRLTSGSTGQFQRLGDGYVTYTQIDSPTISTEWQRYSAKYTPTSEYEFKAFLIRMNSITGSIEARNFQVETGTATSYEPYQSTTKTVDLGSTELVKIGTYQDYIYKSGDDWYVHKEIGKVTYTGAAEESYTSSTAGGFKRFQIAVSDAITGSGRSEVLSNNFLFSNQNNVGVIFLSSGNLYMYPDATITTTTDFKTWLSTNNTIVYYPLATPTDTKITDATLIGELEGVEGTKLFIGENNVLVTANGSNLPATLSFKYYTGINYDGAGFEWEAGGSGGDDMITVDSIDDVYPMLTIPGPVVNPTITNVTTGSVFQYTGTLSSTQKLEVDLMAKTAFLNGVSVIANVTSSSLYFKSGMNRVSYTTNNADAPDATIKWQEIVG